jgi:hypothetical protein
VSFAQPILNPVAIEGRLPHQQRTDDHSVAKSRGGNI